MGNADGAVTTSVTTGSAPDWQGIEEAHRSGLLSVRKIAASNGVSEAAIRQRAKRDGWQREESPPDAPPRRSLQILAHGDKTEYQAIAEVALDPAVTAAATHLSFVDEGLKGRLFPNEQVGALKADITRAQSNDLDGAVAMLVSQASTLDLIFNKLARQASLAIGKNPASVDIYLRQAFRAQSQCRTTLEAVAEIKNPRPVAFIKQQNNAAGPQQVNNGAAPIAGNASKTTHRKT